jgi:hypothetical protein
MGTRSELAARQQQYREKSKVSTRRAAVLALVWAVMACLQIPFLDRGGWVILKFAVYCVACVLFLTPIAYNRSLRARFGLNCPNCGRGLVGTRGEAALASGQCPSCRQQLLTPAP